MLEEKKYRNQHTSRFLYEQYINSNNGQDNKSHFENQTSFRSDLSLYNIETHTIKMGSLCKWDKRNCSGVPLDYSAKDRMIFVDGSDAHTLIIGSTGSKKSRLIVMPTVHTLSAAGENMIICDPKGEIYRRTYGMLRKKSYEVHAINLREPQKGDGWNMLEIPYKLYCEGDIDKACEFVNDMSINLIPIIAKDPYWDYSARDLLFGLTLLLFKICKELNLPDTIVNIQCVLRLKEELFFSTDSYKIQNTKIWEFAKKDDLIRMRLNGTVICPEKTLSCIISTFDQHMSCFLLQPQVVEMLSESTFDVADYGFGKKVIFMIMPDEKTTFHKIVTIFLKQVYEILIDNAFKKTKQNRFPSRINFILDEFSSLPTISDFPQMIAASRSRNIRFTLVVQSKHQLRQRYEEETNTIMSNCANWIFLTSREIELLREVSELSGKTCKNDEPLISVSRLQRLDKEKGECLILCGRKYPYIATIPDIDLYDDANPIQLEFPLRKNIEKQKLPQNYFEKTIDFKFTKKETVKEISEFRLSSDNKIEKNNMDKFRLQKELEEKFDELFGKLDEKDLNKVTNKNSNT